MRISKRSDINSLTDVRTIIAMQKLGISKVIGRTDNFKRILDSNLSWQERIKWINQINSYTGCRRESLEWYTLIYNDENLAKEKMKQKSARVAGENNVWFNHQGRYSVYSKKNPNFSSEAKIKAKEKNSIEQKNGASNTTLSYYLKKGLSLEEAKESLKNRQKTFTLQKCIERYGEEKGKEIFNERQIRWQNTLNSKSESELSEINRKKISKGYNCSKGESFVFNSLVKEFPNVERQFTLKNQKRRLNYDLRYENKIIEYNGDFWHMNPKLYNETDINRRTKRTAKQQWELDESKINVAKSRGYEVLIIWESELDKMPEETILKCINFLKQ